MFCMFALGHTFTWFSNNSQLVWKYWENKMVLAIACFGFPALFCFWWATKIGYIGFGSLWPVRFMGFATSMITFPILTYFYLGETIGLKTAVTIMLSVAIMIIQLI